MLSPSEEVSAKGVMLINGSTIIRIIALYKHMSGDVY